MYMRHHITKTIANVKVVIIKYVQNSYNRFREMTCDFWSCVFGSV